MQFVAVNVLSNTRFLNVYKLIYSQRCCFVGLKHILYIITPTCSHIVIFILFSTFNILSGFKGALNPNFLYLTINGEKFWL